MVTFCCKPAYVQKQMAELWISQNGLCCWCQVQMMRWDDPTRKTKAFKAEYGTPAKPKKMLPTLATLEHLIHKFDRQKPEDTNQVALACWECNNKRGNDRARQETRERREVHVSARTRAAAQAYLAAKASRVKVNFKPYTTRLIESLPYSKDAIQSLWSATLLTVYLLLVAIVGPSKATNRSRANDHHRFPQHWPPFRP